MSRRESMRKALADAGVAVQQGEWADGLLDRLEAAAEQPLQAVRLVLYTADNHTTAGEYLADLREISNLVNALPDGTEHGLPVPEEESNPT